MSGTRGAVVALARVEGPKLARHPAFLAGLAIETVGIAWFVAGVLGGPSGPLAGFRDGWSAGVGFSLLGLLTLMATNQAALRDRRSRTEEQHGSVPVGESARTRALLLADVWPASIVLVFLIGVSAYGLATAGFDEEDLARLAAVVPMMAMLGTLGIALARWIPNPFVAPLAAWVFLLSTNSESTSPLQALSPIAAMDGVGPVLWHLVYVVGLTIVLGAAALLRPDRRTSVVAVGAFGLVMTVASIAVLMTQP